MPHSPPATKAAHGAHSSREWRRRAGGRLFPVSVRVRYAPSPTGFQHIGGVRTALYNYLFARSQGGTFILRIEDTDRERYVEDALTDIYDTFAWLGFHWDEGPDVGGPSGPYLQSQRVEKYAARAAELLEKGHAYRCYCTPERLSRLRERQAASKAGQGYDRHCRNLSETERRLQEAAGAPSVIRLKVPLDGTTTFTDALLGGITVENADINPDPVLIKSDGFPTYHMANVVDDHLMEITHIMRAQEWLPSAPLHMILYRAFGWEQPKLCHLPMVMGKDGQKLSKRHGATNVREFRRLGYLPEALLNYLALVGWSYDDSREFFTLGELERLFSLEKINTAPAVFDYQKLEWFNGSYIRKKTPDELARLVEPVLKEAGFTGDGELMRRIAKLVQERVKLLREVPDMVRFVFEDPAPPSPQDLIPKKTEPARALETLKRADALLGELSDLAEEAETKFRGLAEELGMKLGDLLMPVRIAVTGAKVSPPLFGSIEAMGVARARARLARAISILAEHIGRS
jgi:glutamyl-tRNA synthetase